jgi:hypothetical protein
MFPKVGRKIPTALSNGGVSAYACSIADVLRSELGDSHRAHKTLMRWTGANERTAKNWLSGINGPSGEHLLRIMKNSDQVFECVLMLAGRKPMLSRHNLEELRSALANTSRLLAEAMQADDSSTKEISKALCSDNRSRQ